MLTIDDVKQSLEINDDYVKRIMENMFETIQRYVDRRKYALASKELNNLALYINELNVRGKILAQIDNDEVEV